MRTPDIASLPQHVGRLNTARLGPGARFYNPAICEFNGRIHCAFRVQDDEGISRVRIAWWLSKFWPDNPESFVSIDVPIMSPSAHVEDPRLIVIRGELLLFVVVIDYGQPFHKFVLRGYALDGETFQPTREINLGYLGNGKGKTQKNWMPFEMPIGRLGFIATVSPFRVIEVDTGAVVERKPTNLAKWKWGPINGRTNAVRVRGEWLTLVGGHVANERRGQRYWVAAMTFDLNGPLKISREPILWASDFTPAILNPFDPRWNPACVFPAGLVDEGSTLLVSLGVNDSFCDFLRYDLDELHDGMIPVDQVTGHETCTEFLPADHTDLVRVRVKCKNPLGEEGGPYFHGQEFTTTRGRVQALGAQVEVIL